MNLVHSKYPRGLIPVCLMQCTVMFGFMVIFSLATLYMTKELGYSDTAAVTLFAAYGSIVYGLPLLGGYLGDRFLGFKFSVLFSTICCGIALLLLTLHSSFFFILGLAIFAISNCLQIPNLYCLVGNLYAAQDERRHAGFTIAYVAMNIGAFAGALSAGFLSEHLGYSITYLVGAIVVFSTLIAYFLGNKHFDNGFKTSTQDPQFTESIIVHNTASRLKGIVLFLLAIPVCTLAFKHPDICNQCILVLAIAAVLYIIFTAMRYHHIQRKKLLVFAALTLISVGWATLYMMAPTVLTLFAERNLDRHLFGLTIPASSVLSLNPLFIIISGPLLSVLWVYLTHKNKNPSGALKVSLGVISMGIGFLILVPGIMHANILGLTAFHWIVISYFFQTLGELCVMPVGFALVGSMAPAGHEGFLMGFFQLGTGVASVLMSYLAGSTNKLEGITNPLQTNPMYSHAFWHFGLSSVVLGGLSLLLVPYFAKIIRQTV